MKLETDELTDALDCEVKRLQGRGQLKTLTEIAAISQAISLKRIADALDHNTSALDAIAACVVPEKNMIRTDAF